MKTNYWLSAFILDAILELATNQLDLPILHFVTKSLLMVLLLGYFISVVGTKVTSFKITTVIALFFSWLGDIFLIFSDNALLFLLGLVSFLLAHIAYILSFGMFAKTKNNRIAFVLLMSCATYFIALVYLLWAGLGEMVLPVLMYAIVLTLMGFTGVVRNLGINRLIVIGVLLFVLSDSLIAYNQFIEPIYLSKLLIMSTYVVAQFLIIKGLSERYLKEKK